MSRYYTNEELTKLCRHILYNTEHIVEKKYADFLMKNVLCRHPRFSEKVGCGVDHIEVGDDGCRGKCFYFVRNDGTECDISFTKSISSKGNLHYISEACRLAVWKEIKEMRDSIQIPFKCPISGEIVMNKKDVHVDHYDLEFKDLVVMFIKMKGEDYLISKIQKDYDSKLKKRCFFTDEALNREFLELHNRNTHLRLVSKNANLSILRKKCS